MLDMIADYHKSNICKREDIRDHHTSSASQALNLNGANTTTNFQQQLHLQSTSSSAANARTVTTLNPFTQSTMDKSTIVTAVGSASGSEAVETTMMKPPSTTSSSSVEHQKQQQQQQRRQKLKVKEFNDVIVCNLCRGYLVNATSVDICEHSYCRSCIVKYLETDSNCPNCKPQIRFITLSNLRSDDILRTLVYKLVPGLIQQERERQLHFWKSLDSTSDCDMLMMEEEFIYPAEPISLSLEYHPALLVSCNKSQIPPVRYLQCPAGVTVHHLKRFLCSKYDIDPDNQRVDIDIIYEDEILPEDFSLIDVGYCYNWKRVAPMRFCYRILLHSNTPAPAVSKTTTTSSTAPATTKVLGENNQNDSGSPEAKRAKKALTDSEMMMAPAVPMKTVRFVEPVRKADKNGENSRQVTYSVYKSKSLDMKDSTLGYNNNNNNNEMEREKNESSGAMKMIIARKQSPKRSNSEESVYNITNDFKSLRSNDMRYSDYAVTSNSTSGSGNLIPKTPKDESKPPSVSKCDIVVSIPQSQIHRSPNSSDESMENLSLAELKTAGKKPSPSSPANSPPKPKNVPKLKIELNSPKTSKIAIPKPKSAEVRQEPKKISKRKYSVDEQPLPEKIDLKTYAKNIGLKPIDPDRQKDPLELPKPKTSPDASPMSTSSSASSSTSNGTFTFMGKDEYPSFPSSSSHKKRKKKHSKEPKDSNGKRRKLHAEISSQPENESLKMKVKITGNHRAHKVESRKSSSSSDDVIVTTPPTSLKLPPPMPAEPTMNGKHHTKKPKLAYSPPSSTTPSAPAIPSGASMNLSSAIRHVEASKKLNQTSHKDSEGSKKDSKSKDTKLKDGKSKDSKTKESSKSSKDSKSREGHSQSKEISSKEINSKETSLKEAISKESINKEDSLKETNSSKEGSSRDLSSKEAKSKPSNAPQIMTTIHARIPSKPSPQVSSTGTVKSPVPISKPLSNIQEMKIPASPPLPPSLFKTTPLTITTLTPTSTTPATPPLKPVPRAPVTTPTPNPTPSLPVQQPNRNPPPLKPQFAVPQAPPKQMPHPSHKLSPISSIASSAHKQAAQLKRSASLDGPHPSMLTKQQKSEQDRLVRKSAYGPMFQTQQRPIKPSNSGTSSASAKSHDKPFYTSSIASSYTHEMSKRKPLPMLMPPSSISVTKMSESLNGKFTHSSSSSAVTITSQKKSYTSQNNNSSQISQKPALEILRVPAVGSASEPQKPASVKSSPPKATRPPPAPIPLVKIKKSQSSPSVRSPALTVSTKSTTGHSQASPPGLISMRSIIPAIVASKSAATIAENAPKQPERPSSETNGKSSKEKSTHSSSSSSSSSTLKDRRPSSRDNSVEILDLSGKHSNHHPKPPTPPTPTAGNSLEAALNKIKQNMTSSTVPDSIAASANKSSKLESSTDDLQNLHLLSESATNREKIAIKTLPKLNEISKVRAAQTPVRQQNASVRNIPNPSALAFRNQPQIPMLNSINSLPSSPTPTSPTTTGVVSVKPEFKAPTPPNNSPSSSTNPGSPPRLKKNLNIEQVAANLNMRAAAAADKSEAQATATPTPGPSSAPSSVSTTSVTNSSSNRPSSSGPAENFSNKPAAKTTLATSSNVVSSSSSASPSMAISREPAPVPTQPKTSFKSISSLVASSSSSSTVSAGTA